VLRERWRAAALLPHAPSDDPDRVLTGRRDKMLTAVYDNSMYNFFHIHNPVALQQLSPPHPLPTVLRPLEEVSRAHPACRPLTPWQPIDRSRVGVAACLP
jgi:hypothetical protein